MKNEISRGGVLLLNKPKGITSHDAVSKIRRLYGTRSVGHTGTLDPMATGLLIMLVGRAVKASDYITAQDKIYDAEMKLGIVTDTADITGNVMSRSENIPPRDEVISAAKSFVGRYMQVPPMYSAIKVDGKKLYELAREGKTVELAPRKLFISSIDIDGEGDTYKMRVACSKGTYIRTLCEDIGKRLGCGATMSALCRYSSGGFTLDDAVTPEELEDFSPEERTARLIPAKNLFSELESVSLPDFYARLCLSGCEIYQKKIGTRFDLGERVKIYTKDGFIGVGEVKEYPDGTAIKLFIRLI